MGTWYELCLQPQLQETKHFLCSQVPAARCVCRWQNRSSLPVLSPWHPAWHARAGGRWTVCRGMSPALRLLLSLAGCTLLGGALLPPRDVRLEAQNFHVRLRWEPDPAAAFQAAFQVEWRRRTSQWTDAGACWGNSTGPSWVCELYFDKIHDIYWARVRAVARGKHSEWAYSSELQLYRDTIVGPPRLSWLLQGDILSVNIIMPLTPYRRKTGSHKPVDQVLLKLWYWLCLYEGDVLVQQVPCRQSGEEAPCTFSDLKPSTQYCIRTVAADMSRERSHEAEQCMMTAVGTAGFPWVLLVVLSGVFLLLTVSGLCFLQRLLFHSPSETHLPKTLVLGCQVSLLPEEDGETRDGDDVLEQSVPVGLVGDSYTGDREYQTSKTWLSLHLQLYSKCQCPAPEAGSCLPLPTPGRSPRQEDEQERLGLAGRWIPLSSVKLPASEEEEEDGGQFICTHQPLRDCGAVPQAGDGSVQEGAPEQVAPGAPSPGQPRTGACGYEPRPSAREL
ncbi:uncharacterized protein LOC115613306 isoform X5 [Strigops habroptila]|uniref:uncharacterized protein LOC115613306 isoform X5 n=1 Tax=Strigops habroptila TaxID=2489341 RepID=UPI0011CEE9CD|nr:uncharacterized protein LOC115613306 isoform X5 [Strigops habroptila]